MSKSRFPQPRLRDDVGEIVRLSAKKNRRTIPQEVDTVLREHYFGQRWPIVGIGPNGENAENSRPTSLADELRGKGKKRR